MAKYITKTGLPGTRYCIAIGPGQEHQQVEPPSARLDGDHIVVGTYVIRENWHKPWED